MLNFNITSGSDHLLALRNYVRCNGCTDQAVLAVLFDELEIPLEDYMKNIIGLGIYGSERHAFRDYTKFGIFHSVPDFESLTAEMLDSISRVVVSAHIQDHFPIIIRTACDLEKKIVTIYYEYNNLGCTYGSRYSNFTQQGFSSSGSGRPIPQFQPTVLTNVLELAVTELAAQCQPVAKFGDLNCYSVSSEEVTEAIAKHTKVSGISKDYLLLRDILQRLYPTYEEFLAERNFITIAGKICNELAACSPEERWKKSITMERIISHIRFLSDEPTHGRMNTQYGYGEDSCDKFLADLYKDTRSEQELEVAEINRLVNDSLTTFGYDDKQDLCVIVIQDQPTAD